MHVFAERMRKDADKEAGHDLNGRFDKEERKGRSHRGSLEYSQSQSWRIPLRWRMSQPRTQRRQAETTVQVNSLHGQG